MSPISRYFGLEFDGMIGKDFDKGLVMLAQFAGRPLKADFAGLQIEAASVDPVTVAYLSTSSAKNDAAIAAARGGSRRGGRLHEGPEPEAGRRALTIDTGSSDSGYLFDAAIPVAGMPSKPVLPDSRVKLKQTYGGKVLKVALRGSYSQIPATYDKIVAYIAAHGIDTNGNPWDEFANDPTTVKESEVLTNIYFPIK
jgi:effector-binding domain-containing protein